MIKIKTESCIMSFLAIIIVLVVPFLITAGLVWIWVQFFGFPDYFWIWVFWIVILCAWVFGVRLLFSD